MNKVHVKLCLPCVAWCVSRGGGGYYKWALAVVIHSVTLSVCAEETWAKVLVVAPAAGTGEGCVHVRFEDGKILKPSAQLESGEVWLSVLRGVRWGISGATEFRASCARGRTRI